MADMQSKNTGGYGKRPLWQWIVLYLIIGGVAYFLIYYFVFAKKGYNYGSNYGNNQQNTQQPYSY